MTNNQQPQLETPTANPSTPDSTNPLATDKTRKEDTRRALPAKSGWLDFNLKPVTKTWRAMTFGQPLIGAGYAAVGLGLLGHRYGPQLSKWLLRLTSPKMTAKQKAALDEQDEEAISKQRRLWTWTLGGLGALGALGTVALNYRSNAPDKGLFSYYPMEKTESLVSPGIPIDKCMDMISNSDSLTPAMKLQSIELLNSFNAPPTARVNGNDLVEQAITTGQSAATGLAVGYLTATALGLPNPKSTAILGAVANTLGVGPALATALTFGE